MQGGRYHFQFGHFWPRASVGPFRDGWAKAEH